MDTANNICDPKKELDDSGCVQDDLMQIADNQMSLLDFSDDVLLCIFKHCSAVDLKALGHSCIRLSQLIRERSLWRQVDACSKPCSRARLKWYLENVLHADTHTLKVQGYAKAAKGCVGLINILREDSAADNEHCYPSMDPLSNVLSICEAFQEIPSEFLDRVPPQVDRQQARYFISAQRPQLPRHRCCMSWLDDNVGRTGPNSCSGPQFTVSPQLFQQLAATCPHLTTLCLDYCNLDCDSTGLSLFPKTLRRLSLRGSKCYNVTFDKSFVYKIQDHLPLLMSLDVSECEWMEPAALLPLSKMTALEELIMQDCYKMSEFVAYASLTARYGFKTLKSLDLRGSPVGDSEVSALGWLPKLEKLWLCARGIQRVRSHAHYADDERSEHLQLDPWEISGLDHVPIIKSNSDTSADNIGSDADVSLDGSSPSNEMNNNAKDDSQNKDTKRKPRGRNASKNINGEPSPKRRKGHKSDDNPDNRRPRAYRTVNVFSINGLRSEVGIDNPQNRNNDDCGKDAGDANEAKSNLEPIHVSVSNNQVCPNMCPLRDRDIDDEIKDSAENIKIENEEIPKSNEENTDNSDEIQENNNSGEKSDQLPERHPGRHASDECMIDCMKVDQLHEASTARCDRNEVIIIASSSRKRLPRRLQIKSSRNSVIFAMAGNDIRMHPDRMNHNQNVDESRPGPSNEGVPYSATEYMEEELAKYLRKKKRPDSHQKSDASSLKKRPDDIHRPEQMQMDEQEHVQNSEQMQRTEQIQTPEQVQSQNMMQTPEHVQSLEQVQRMEHRQSLDEVQKPKQVSKVEKMREPEQKDRSEQMKGPENLQMEKEKLRDHPVQMEKHMQEPEQRQMTEPAQKEKEKHNHMGELEMQMMEQMSKPEQVQMPQQGQESEQMEGPEMMQGPGPGNEGVPYSATEIMEKELQKYLQKSNRPDSGEKSDASDFKKRPDDILRPKQILMDEQEHVQNSGQMPRPEQIQRPEQEQSQNMMQTPEKYIQKRKRLDSDEESDASELKKRPHDIHRPEQMQRPEQGQIQNMVQTPEKYLLKRNRLDSDEDSDASELKKRSHDKHRPEQMQRPEQGQIRNMVQTPEKYLQKRNRLDSDEDSDASELKKRSHDIHRPEQMQRPEQGQIQNMMQTPEKYLQKRNRLDADEESDASELKKSPDDIHRPEQMLIDEPEHIQNSEQMQRPEQRQIPEQGQIQNEMQTPKKYLQGRNRLDSDEESDASELKKRPHDIHRPEQMQRPEQRQIPEQEQRPEQGQRMGRLIRPLPIQYQVEPRHHVLYVGVGPQLNTYRFPRDASELVRHVNCGPTHMDSRSLVTDFAIRRFGRARDEDVNIIHLDPHGPMVVGQASGSRPDRSSLRVLSVNGYRNVTDRSLVHLATAAPDLEHVDFTGTSVSANGVKVFKSLHPDCEFVHSPFEEME